MRPDLVLRALAAGLRDLASPALRGMLLRALGLTVALLLGLSAGAGLLVDWLLPDSISLPWLGEVAWLDELASGLTVTGLLIASIFLMVPVAGAFAGLFLDKVAAAIEARHYPDRQARREVGLLEGLADALGYLATMLAVNAAALLVYLLFAPLAPLIFWAVNGVLLAREHAALVAMRHLSPAEARAFRQRHRWTLRLAGVGLAATLSLPLANLFAPVLGAACFTHLFHLLTGGGAGRPPVRG